MNKPLISVIIPIYKVEKYIKECVNSVLRQTYQNLEVILVDDGSPDSCPMICDEFAKIDNRVVVLHKTNGGLSSARNAGIDIAKGDYLSFIDGDDFISDVFIEKLFLSSIKYGCDIVACSYLKLYEDGKTAPFDYKYDGRLYSKNELHLGTFYKEILTVAWNKLYKKHIFENLRYPVGKLHEDEFLIHRVVDNCVSVFFDKSDYYYYRQRGDSIMGNRTAKDYYDAFLAFFDRSIFFSDKGMFVSSLDCALTAKSFYKQTLKYKDFIKDKDFVQKNKKVIKDSYRKIDKKQLTVKKRTTYFIKVYLPFVMNVYSFIKRTPDKR